MFSAKRSPSITRTHGSVERALVQVHMPRMSRAELREIVSRGVASAQMTIGRTAVDRIAALSQGLPHYTHLLSQLAAQSALDGGRTDIKLTDVDFAVRRAIDKAQQSIMDAHHRATFGTRRSLYPQVIVACALATCDDFGFFAALDVRDPLSRIAGKTYDTRSFVHHLDELSTEERGPVLQKRGVARQNRYRFANPLLQPYVVMKALAEGLIQPKDVA